MKELRHVRAKALRAEGLPYAKIGARLGISPQGARSLCWYQRKPGPGLRPGRKRGPLVRATYFGAELDRHYSRLDITSAELQQRTGLRADQICNFRLYGAWSGQDATKSVSPNVVDVLADGLGLTPAERQKLHLAAALDKGYRLSNYVPDGHFT